MGRVKKEEDLGPEADENWKSKDPKALAYEIATFMGGEWPTRPVRKVQLSLDGVPSVRFAPGIATPGSVRAILPWCCGAASAPLRLRHPHSPTVRARGVRRPQCRIRLAHTHYLLPAQGDEELFELTQLNPTLLSEMSTKTRHLFLEVYLEDLQDVYSQVMETLDGDKVSRHLNPAGCNTDRVRPNAAAGVCGDQSAWAGLRVAAGP